MKTIQADQTNFWNNEISEVENFKKAKELGYKYFGWYNNSDISHLYFSNEYNDLEKLFMNKVLEDGKTITNDDRAGKVLSDYCWIDNVQCFIDDNE